MKYYN